jgi:hypothetical protein
MAKPSFVGYQEKVEIPEGFELLEISEKIESNLEKQEIFSLLTEPELLSRWFYTITKMNARPGGKVNFLDDHGVTQEAICTSIDFGKEISLISDLFGSFVGRVSKSSPGSSIELNFKILTNDSSEKKSRIQESIEKLRLLTS